MPTAQKGLKKTTGIMMKSKVALLVLSALALSSAHAAEIYNKDANKLDLYGKVKGEHDFANHSNADATYARLGFRGETQINSDVTGFGQFEHQFNVSQPEGSQTESTRLAFAGLNFGDAGSIDYGRNYGVVYDIGSYADNLTEFGGDSYQTTDNYMTGRSTGLLTYRNTNFFGLVDGLAVAAQYQGANEDRNWKKSNGEGYGFSLQYDIADTGLTVGGAYSNAKTSDAKDSFGYKVASGENAEAWTVGAKYAANAFYLATTYAETRNMTPITLTTGTPVDAVAFLDKTENFEAMAAYTFDFGLTPSVGYVQSRAHSGDVSATIVKYVELGAAYNFNKNFVVDAGYKINLVNDELAQYGIATDNQAVLGATYQF